MSETTKTIKSVDKAAADILDWAKTQGFETAFDRVDKMKPCPIGHSGACCKTCFMGPCRFTGKDAETGVIGICGASLATIAARHFLRMCAAGTAAHSDHARDMALTLRGAADGHAPDFKITDPQKLKNFAKLVEVSTEGKSINEIAIEVADKVTAQFGLQTGETVLAKTAPPKRVEIWRKHKIVPRGIDREVVEAMHRTNMGVDQDPDSLMTAALRVGMTDGWAGSMFSTAITDILFGTPKPLKASASAGVLSATDVNIIVHGHEPTLAEMIVLAVQEPEMIAYAKKQGATGINLTGVCCTANEVLMRNGISTAGGFLNQELVILTGLAEAITVDVQCIMPGINKAAANFHTKVITTSNKGRMENTLHIPYDEHRAREVAREIVKTACDNFKNRTTKGSRGHEKQPLIAGFSHEYINYMLGGSFRPSFRPLNDAIMAGRIRGVAGIVGCNNPRTVQDENHNYLIGEFIKNDVLVVVTGCGAASAAKAGYLTPETALEKAGPGLRQVCEATGMPPVLHLGACVDNTRILTIATQMAAEGGLGDDISDIPAIGIAPEWMSEKALAIACYVVASGCSVIFGSENIVRSSSEVTRIMTDVWEERYGAWFKFIPEKEEILRVSLEHIDKKRDALKLRKYERGAFGVERKLMDMAARRKLEMEKA